MNEAPTGFQVPKKIKGERKVWVAYLLWITFVGHRWYLGQTAPLYFITIGWFGVMWFVDLFRIPRMVRKYNTYVYQKTLAQSAQK